jgi:hypothetical protein
MSKREVRVKCRDEATNLIKVMSVVDWRFGIPGYGERLALICPISIDELFNSNICWLKTERYYLVSINL